ncbi:glycerophosphodiester phosphodiesterase [Aureimonas leprariae]|uniref:Glycerophosphodiester phosphodiesterase n=1 Tax=Plantimonas leprariae TaxID=2615207 RepID=A0A7V7TVW0_9HYPH|nr:glycerophosphodiester phosphodiesterase [Aureimonas leprariae]KAB0678507.1 glycerophosphodiester phosphodiesterase [Aureimonas leprariae]
MRELPVALDRGGRRVRLKWHRARRRPGDTPFGAANVAAGLAGGAEVEIDLLAHAGDGFAVLHDERLDDATTGSGPVADAEAGALRACRLRDADGRPTELPVLLFSDLCRIVGEAGGAGRLQLDLKNGADVLSDARVAAFAAAARPAARRMILSGGDAGAVRRLAGAVPGLAIGHDPCHFGASERLRESLDFASFAAGALAEAPDAALFYLAKELVLLAADHGFDLVAPFHAAGREVDAYTVAAADGAADMIVPRLLELRVDQITTDDAEGLAARFG